jgi:hypothetical protein
MSSDNMDPISELWHRVDVGNVADISEILAVPSG